MDDEPKKKRKTYDENDCVTAVAVSAVAGIFVGLWYETGQTFGKWIEAEILAFLAAFIVVGIIICIPLGAIDQYKDKNKSVGIFTLIAACLVTNLVFLYASWSIRKIEISNENARQEEYYQSGYEDGARDARAEMQEYYDEMYFNEDEVNDIAEESFSYGYSVGYDEGYAAEDDAYNSWYNEGFSDGERHAFRAVNGLGITDMSGDEIMDAWNEYFSEMIETYGMLIPPRAGEGYKKLIGAPNGTLHIEGCEELWGMDINSFIYFDSVEEGINSGYDPACEECDPQNCSWVRLNSEEE